MITVFEVVAPHGSEVEGVVVRLVENEWDTTVPRFMGSSIAVSIEDGCVMSRVVVGMVGGSSVGMRSCVGRGGGG